MKVKKAANGSGVLEARPGLSHSARSTWINWQLAEKGPRYLGPCSPESEVNGKGHGQMRGSCSAVSNYRFLRGGLLSCLIRSGRIGVSVYIETLVWRGRGHEVSKKFPTTVPDEL